jgi:prophage DNA circulation protein
MTPAEWIVAYGTIVTDADDSGLLADYAVKAAGTGAEAAEAALKAAIIIGESVTAPADAQRLIASAGGAGDAGEAATLVIASVAASCAAPRADWRTTHAAQAAREALSELLDLAYAECSARFGADALRAVSGVGGTAIRALSELSANLVPIVRAETGISLPSALIAWDLYADPHRAGNLVATAGSVTPMLMPIAFNAEAPDV